MPEFDFGHFHIVKELGRGGMALVYEAVDLNTEEIVALKILYPHLMSEENNIRRFQREAQLASQLIHPYIVPVVAFGEHENQLYMALKYMPGRSLAELFKNPQELTLENTVRILGEVASALDYAHDKGVIHRDLKLQNILLDEDHHAHLSDFGIARLADSTRLTATGQVAGTPMYMSPEQIRGKALDHRSDIYSFSVMAYLLLTGYYPFTGDDALAILHKHVKEDPPFPSHVNPDLPEVVDSIILRGLMKLPDDRYDSTMMMVEMLRRVVAVESLQHTSTRIDIHATNPLEPRERPDDIVASSKVSSQSDLSSALITEPQILQGTGSKMGIFGLSIIVLVVLAIVIPLVLLIIGNNNNDNESALASSIQTQVKRETDFIATQTALSIQLTQSEMDDDENDDDDDDAPRANPSPLATFPEANAIIIAPNGAPLIDGPGPGQRVIMMLDDRLAVQIIGRTLQNDFLEIVTAEKVRGYVNRGYIETAIEIDRIDVTWFPTRETLEPRRESLNQSKPPPSPPPRNEGDDGN